MVNRPMEIDGVKYFKCKKCGEVKLLNKCYFHINTVYSTGFCSKCKSCVKEERDSKPKVKYITRAELEEENRKLKEDNRFLTKISKEYMEKENIVQVTEFTELYKDELEEENKKLSEENKKLSEENGQLKEKIETLELRLDNKEKLNEEYRKQLDYRHHRAMKDERGGEEY